MRPRVYIHSWAPEDVLSDLGRDYAVDCYDTSANPPLSAEAFGERLAGAVAVMIHTSTLDGDMIAANAETLKVIASIAVGTDHIDVAAATRHGILVTNTSGVLTEAVADFAIGMVLAVGRRIAEADRFTRAGHFQGNNFGLYWGGEVNGETLGIVGMGRIGQATARRARGFGMKLIYHNRNPVADSIADEVGATWRPLEDLLGQSRYVILLTPLTPETHHLIDESRLRLMRSDAYLINVSRGPVVHEAALLAALQAGRLAGAALDVYENEPALADGLAALENVVLTPHVASADVATRHNMLRLAATNLKAALAGEPVPNPVNRVG
ncbi:MAG: D-glycerate dehydrogenase [Alphaproteobacteria bacterium]|nr:D-glycerate dehydrogenase [Alphaproteobacteria bacterium]MDP6517833.1 D-glycerate dehydrogenase [Alphaproteobacteria bacterium]